MNEVRSLLEPVEDGPLNAMLMTGTGKIHREAERVPFMVAFFKGELSREQYAGFLSRLLPVYEALEETAEALKDHPTLGALYAPELFRTEGLRKDIAYYAPGTDLPSETPAAKAYADRVREVSGTHGWVAHQWLRYLGYVMGQELLRKLCRNGFGVTDEGLEFYAFPSIESPRDYLLGYHARMNDLPLSLEEKMQVVDEGYRAFQLNIGVTQELATDYGIGNITEQETTELLDDLKAQHP
jgi:heme oxygenase (biliverdin-producing, ferredoxin)